MIDRHPCLHRSSVKQINSYTKWWNTYTFHMLIYTRTHNYVLIKMQHKLWSRPSKQCHFAIWNIMIKYDLDLEKLMQPAYDQNKVCSLQGLSYGVKPIIAWSLPLKLGTDIVWQSAFFQQNAVCFAWLSKVNALFCIQWMAAMISGIDHQWWLIKLSKFTSIEFPTPACGRKLTESTYSARDLLNLSSQALILKH